LDDQFAHHETELGAIAARLMSPRADEGPIMMLNLLKFVPDGESVYLEYSEANAPLFERFGVELIVAATVGEAIVGRDHWDQMTLVRYPTRRAFIDMLNTELFWKNEGIRARSIEDSELIVMDPLDFWEQRADS
jgi:uncharacterized protein (DUF1330 family)